MLQTHHTRKVDEYNSGLRIIWNIDQYDEFVNCFFCLLWCFFIAANMFWVIDEALVSFLFLCPVWHQRIWHCLGRWSHGSFPALSGWWRHNRWYFCFGTGCWRMTIFLWLPCHFVTFAKQELICWRTDSVNRSAAPRFLSNPRDALDWTNCYFCIHRFIYCSCHPFPL